MSTPKRGGSGRPRKPVAYRETFTVRVTAAQRGDIVRAAARAGKAVRQWAREVLVAASAEAPRSAESQSDTVSRKTDT